MGNVSLKIKFLGSLIVQPLLCQAKIPNLTLRLGILHIRNLEWKNIHIVIKIKKDKSQDI